MQFIVFSFAALETSAEANTPSMSPSMCLRFLGCANNLNRGSQKAEQALAKHLTDDVTDGTNTANRPVQIPQSCLITQKPPCPLAQKQPVILTQKEQDKRLWGAAMTDTPAQMGMPVKPASTT